MRLCLLLWVTILAATSPVQAQDAGTLKKIRDTGEIVLGAVSYTHLTLPTICSV